MTLVQSEKGCGYADDVISRGASSRDCRRRHTEDNGTGGIGSLAEVEA